MPQPAGDGRRKQPLLLALVIVGLVLLAWRLSDVLLLGFGGVLVAVLLRNLARGLARLTGLRTGAALAAVALGLVALAALFVVSVGPQVATQFEQLWQALPQAMEGFRSFVARYDWGRDLLEAGGPPRAGTLVNLATGLLGTVFNALSDALLVLVVALFLAADPAPYRGGLLRLVPPARRARGGEVLDALADGLWRWILGQSVAMLCIGAITATGLMLLGIPLALALGILAGLLNFIPYLGPILSGAPAVLIAFAQGPTDALYTLLLFVFIQSLEGYVLTPMLQRQAVSIPPALGILAIVGLGSLFGAYGVLFATPLLLVIIVLVRMLYVEDTLEDQAGQAR
ncbi:AI-2E family transporter [Siccirubricoccus sp. G192]|uniref:AI-2E family transporter n=1 Tax=Siccirubricoccus sp. G192 TaxID=2849651 RepID=UPI001C2C3EC7|nr:AI-2E family transporter [Siccirubricoccus sp. G192]MBV1796816.1 AI-2E family transporter [Siccirubricoccus sp. G192]